MDRAVSNLKAFIAGCPVDVVNKQGIYFGYLRKDVYQQAEMQIMHTAC